MEEQHPKFPLSAGQAVNRRIGIRRSRGGAPICRMFIPDGASSPVRVKLKTNMKNQELIIEEQITKAIYLIRDQKVMLDSELAELYGVSTKVLNQAVKRNKESTF